jgi:hypothetical protein
MKDNDEQARGGRAPWIVAGAAAGLCVLTAGGQAQEGGTLATLGLSFGGQYTANDPGEDESRFTTNLSFDLRSATQSQSFGLSADGRFVQDGDGFDFDNPGLALDYARGNRSTALSFGMSYRERDVDGELAVIDPLTLTLVDFIEDDGTRQSLQTSIGLQTGLDARFETDTRLSFSSRTYSGTTDPDLTDLETWQARTAMRFEVDPRITLRGSASYLESQEEDALRTERRNTRVGIGADFLIDPLWTASVGLSFSDFETERDDGLGGRVATREDGAGFSVAVSRAFRTGSLGLSLSREITTNGAEDRVRLSRDRAFANGAELAWSLGLVSFENGDSAPVASLAFALPTPRGGVSVDLQQTTSVDSDDRNTRRTVLDVDVNHEINSVSSWSLNGSLAGVEVVGGTGDEFRAEAGVAYNYALTEDWALSTRLRHRVTYEDGSRDNSASILSLSLQRSFSFRP